MKKIVIIPVFNEEKTINQVIKDLKAHLPSDIDILLIDDGSHDRSLELLQTLPAHVISLPYNLGIGGAVQTGFQFACAHDYDMVAQFDADGQHRADELLALFNTLSSQPELDMVNGSRFIGKDGFQSTFPRRIGIYCIRWLLKILSHRAVTDPTSGFRAFRQRAFSILAQEYPPDYPEPEVFLICRQHQLNFTEIPVRMEQRQGGRSSISPRVALLYFFKVSLSLLVRWMQRPRLLRR